MSGSSALARPAPPVTTITVPLFPLPRTVLFPDVRLPFYVFEPRYRQMLADVLDGPGLLGVPQILPGFESDSKGTPPFTQIFGVGEIGDYTTHDDGTSHIEVIGVHRVQLEEELPAGVYRTARVTVLDESAPTDVDADQIRERLSSAVRALLPLAVPENSRQPLERFLAETPPPLPALVNTLSTVLVADARLRQTLLEIDDIERRGRRLASEIEELRRNLTERADRAADEQPPGQDP